MRWKLVAVAVAALAPVVAMLGYNEFAMRSQRNDEVRAQAAQAARQASSEVDRIVEGLHSLLISVRSMPAVQNLNADVCSASLRAVASSVPNIRMIFVVDLQGRPVCGSVEPPAGVAFADRDYFKAAVAGEDFVVGTYTKSRMSDAAVLPVAMPVVVDGATKAVVVSGVKLDWLQNRIAERGVSPGNAVTMADSGGTILARVPFPERFVGTVFPDDFLKLVHAEEPGVLEVTSQDGTERILGYRPIAPGGSPLYVSAGFSKAEAFAPINRATTINVVAIAGGVLVAFLAAFFVGNRFLLAPIASVAGVMDRWRAGELSARSRMKPTDEVHAVGATLDSLLDELDCRRIQNERAEEERTLLVRELAHRVKNGFALVQAIARQSFGKANPEAYHSFAERLASLASTYDLLLSKDATASTVREVVQTALRAHAGDDHERLRLDGPEVALPADLALPLSLVVHELATNATKYGSLGDEGGGVSIKWTYDDTRLHLVWTETGGPPVSPPTRKGFGSVLIERAFPARAGALCKPDYRPQGLVFEVAFSVEQDSGVEVSPLKGRTRDFR
ncbi:sensor histidine kinase [Rhizobium leguminosarum]|uniref:histidine kinase n=1 Tax=Rhizobium leguminosarum TaxID=384 RepID=A0A7K3VSK5_RHILE|nr:cache domain-containing protein [Rhizobium leguminosarum]NEK19852.1 histidine kinase [Rhizobium leguminosarum]NEK34313.1 histidine kinase [Rhizobium leguminosarum]